MNRHDVGDLVYANAENEFGIIVKVIREDDEFDNNNSYEVEWMFPPLRLFHTASHIDILKENIEKQLKEYDGKVQSW